MKIILAIDGSPGSNAAVEEVCRRPWPLGTEARVITVIPYLEPFLDGVGNFPTTSALDYLFKLQAEKAEQFLNIVVAKMKACLPNLTVSRALLEGRPKDAILEDAKSWGADLIVLGSHGYGMVGRLLLGSVSLAVALNAPCSVEIVRPSLEVGDH